MAVLLLRDTVTSTNYTPIINILSWVLLASMLLAVAAKVTLKALVNRSFNADDAILLVALVSKTIHS